MPIKQKTYGYADMITLAFKVSPFYSTFSVAHNVFNALLPTLQIFIVAGFINTAVNIFQGDAEMSAIYGFVAMLAGLMIYNSLNGVIVGRVNCYRDIYFRKKLLPVIFENQARLEYKHIENPDSADLIRRVCPELDKKVLAMYTGVLGIVKLAVFTLGIMVTLFLQIWWVGLVMALFAAPLVYLANKAGQETYQANRDVTKYERRYEYLSNVLMNREAVEERSVFDYCKDLNNNYETSYEYARKFNVMVYIRNFMKYKIVAMLSTVYPIGAMLVLITPAVSGDLDFGMFIALITAVFGLAERLSQGINAEITELIKNREFLKDLTSFVFLEKIDDAEAEPIQDMSFDTIEFKNVKFKYPQSEKLVLDGVSFVINKGGHYSFVGENGAGKTTITKLITGLYTNYEGEILVDGRSLRELPMSEIKGLSSVVYQDFARYYVSLYDNIAIGGLHKCGEEEIMKAVNSIGLTDAVSSLKDGINTPLGKIIENGVDISGGEWQRIAMARSIVNKAPLRIFDEPTAALDPISESKVYRNFETISAKGKDKTVIFISHRLGSTKLADTIFVLSDGKIAEKGSHENLIAQNNMYAKMFESQSKWYGSAETGGSLDE